MKWLLGRFRKVKSLKNQIFYGFLFLIGLIAICIFFLIFFFWEKYVKDSIYQAMQNNNYQIERNINYYFDDIIKLSEYPFSDSEIIQIMSKNYNTSHGEKQKIDKINDRNTIDKKLYQNIFYLNKKIESVWIFWGEGSYAVKTRGSRKSSYDIKTEDWYEKVATGNGKPFIIGVHKDKSDFMEPEVISIARSIINPSTGEPVGVIVINTLASEFVTLWYSFDNSNTFAVVADKNKHFIFPQIEEGKCKEVEKFLIENWGKYEFDKSYKVKIENESYYLAASEISKMEGMVYQFHTVRDATEGIRIVLVFIVLIIACVFLLLVSISVAISNSITEPVGKLVSSMQDVESGNLEIQSEEFHGELETLSRTFNEMMKKTDHLFKQMQIQEKEKRNLEMLALQAQINPHFMYNTLNSIRWLAEIQGADNITQVLDAFIKVLRYLASDKGEMVDVEEEVIFIKNYIKILNFRYFERFTFSYKIDERTLHYKTLRFVLQPIIENAILHGFDSSDLYAVIEIKIYLEDDLLVMEVTDNGKGISKQRCEEILTKENPEGKKLNRIGIYNVNQRIKLAFGEEYAVKILSKEKCYTKVIVKIPAIYEEETDKNETGRG